MSIDEDALVPILQAGALLPLEQISQTARAAEQQNMPFLHYLISEKIIDPVIFAQACADYFSAKIGALDQYTDQSIKIDHIPLTYLQYYYFIPIEYQKKIIFAISDPNAFSLLKKFKFETNCEYECVADLKKLDKIDLMDFERVHSAHWNVERFHRAIKQVCNVERFQVRREHPIKNHIFCALKAFVRLEFMRLDKIISHWYEVRRDLFVTAIRHFILQSA